MKIFDLPDELGRLRAFEIESASISREGVIKVLKSIPRLVVIRTRAWYGRGEDFCDFEVAGSSFQVREPSDWRPRYWIGPASPLYSPKIELARAAFSQHGAPRWISPLRIFSVSSMAFGAILLTVFLSTGPSTEWGLLAMVAGGCFLVGVVVLFRITILMRDGKQR